MKTDHLQPEEIESYLRGTLDEIENEAIIQHLGECQECLEEVEQLWNENETIGRIDNEKMKGQLLKKIHRTNLVGNFIKLSIRGFLFTAIGLLFPLQGKKQDTNQKKESSHEY
jgi:hypothetical protein